MKPYARAIGKTTQGTGHALGAKKSLGQNFLQDKNIAAKIVSALEISHDDRVLEIGPGPGALSTWILKARPALFLMLEKDRHWAAVRSDDAENQRHRNGLRVHSILGDAMQMSWERLTLPWKILGNLPYNVASPLMWDILSRAVGLTKAVFMVQKEVAERLTAKPGCRAYGALSAWVQSFSVPKLLFDVPPQVFLPRPKVTSAVVSFTPLPLEQWPEDPQGLSNLLAFCFQRRRKQAQNIFREFFGEISSVVLDRYGFDPLVRPENFSPGDFQKLVKAVKSNTTA